MKALSAAGTVIAAVALLGTSQSTTLLGSNLTFWRSMEICSGALGSITFSLNHARAAGQPGVNVDEDENGDMLTITFVKADGSKRGTATVDRATHGVSAKNMRVERNRQIACILPD